jgi:hypothetical protein
MSNPRESEHTRGTASSWPPPPDLASIKELVRNADIEGFIADGAPADEYDTEAELLFDFLEDLPTNEIVAAELLPILEAIWRKDFSLDDDAIAKRRPALLALAATIARFFGPQAQPQVRTA